MRKNCRNKRFALILTASLLFLFNRGIPHKILEKRESGHKHHRHLKISRKLQYHLLYHTRPKEISKIWIYFTDKGIFSLNSLRKSFHDVQQNLSRHCLWRRSKMRQEDQLVDYFDLPLFPPYTEEVKSKVVKVRTVSRWLNALSVEATLPQIMDIAKLDFVRKIDLLTTFHRDEPPLPPQTGSDRKRQGIPYLNYGSSFTQINQINVIPLHQLGYSGQDVLVCLLDTGFRKSHEIFQHAQIVAEWDFVNGDNDVEQDPFDPQDYSDSHGTGTWSLLGGYKPGELIGPAYGARFILAKTESIQYEEQIEEDYWVAGIEWAEALGAEVVSSSLGYTDWYTFADLDGQSAVTTIAANRAVDLGVVVVNAAGNERNNSWGHIIAPADGFKVIAVGAVDSSGEIASFSSPGPTYDGRIKPEVCALGVHNWVASNNNNGSDYYQEGSGTSFATPLVAGAAALLLEIHRDWTPLHVYSALQNTASRSFDPNNDYGWGIINAYLAASLDFSLLKLQDYTIDDDTSGDSFGNGNDVAEPGETLELTVSLKNESQVTAITPQGTLISPHPAIKILRSEVNFPSISPSESQSSESSFVVKIPAFFLGHHAIFHLEVKGPNTITLKDRLRILISRY